MAFLKKANAMLVHPRISGSSWNGIRKVASSSSNDLSSQAHQILGGPLDPDRYLISHCTIVASVDVDMGTGDWGIHKAGSVNRKYADYLIRPECSQFVNNNGDSWSREVLKKSYRTFIGAHNFQEHVQIEDQSKGRIIDAAARDIGDSLYIDILVATDRKHTNLVQDIEMGKMATLSMGCTTDFTLCSKCGHYAEDETQLCDHIKYAKLNTFMGPQGKKRVIAELCGHKDYDETGGVRFIEASWVAVPAFKGAVMRNILSPAEAADQVKTIEDVVSTPPPTWSEEAVLKAANLRSVKSFDFDDGGSEDKAEPEAPSPPFKDVEDALYEKIKERIKVRLEKEMRQDNAAAAVAIEGDSMGPNDTLNKEASYQTMVRIASSPVALVEGIAHTDASYGIQVSPIAYRAALKAGKPERYGSPSTYLRACQKLAGRELTPAEFRVVVRIGTLLSHWERINNPQF